MSSTFLTNSWNQITKVNYHRINYKKEEVEEEVLECED